MQVKTFEGATMNDAIKAVKAEFGRDAVIVSTKKVPIEDSEQTLFEVTAARSQARSQGASPSPAPSFDKQLSCKLRKTSSGVNHQS